MKRAAISAAFFAAAILVTTPGFAESGQAKQIPVNVGNQNGSVSAGGWGASRSHGSLWDDFDRMRQRMMSMFDREDFFGGRAGFGAGRGGYPSMDVAETETAFVVTVDVPGIPKEDLDVQTDGGILTVTGNQLSDKSHSEEEGEGHTRYYFRERRMGGFERSLSLPDNVDASQAVAAHKDGVLTVTLPKTQTQPTAVKLQIQ